MLNTLRNFWEIDDYTGIQSLWFEDANAEQRFWGQVDRCNGPAGEVLLLDVAKVDEQNLVGLKEFLCAKIRSGKRRLFLKNFDGYPAFSELVFEVKMLYKHTVIFLQSPGIYAALLSDNVLCVNGQGQITEEFYPDELVAL